MEEDTVLWTKFQLRRSMQEQLRALSARQVQEWSAEVATSLQQRADLWQKPGWVALFGGLRAEPDLISYFLPWLHQLGWRTVLFAIQGSELLPYEVTKSADLERGVLGAWVPVMRPGQEVAPEVLDVILVPALAFAESDGSRLGRGGGYYDRFLAKPGIRARRVGVGFETQVTPTVPCEPHDSRVQELVTEKRWRTF